MRIPTLNKPIRRNLEVIAFSILAIVLLAFGHALRERLEVVERNDAAVDQFIDRMTVGYDALLAENPTSNLETPEEIAEAVAEDIGVDVEELAPTPTGPQGERGEAGPIGETGPGPTSEQIQEAVDSYCSVNNRCSGDAGPQGNDGSTGDSGPQGEQGEIAPGPTHNQLLAAVAAYCSEAGCVGDSGPTGPIGPQGRPPTAEEVAAAIDSYCSNGGCTGPQGEQGIQGPIGPVPTQEQINEAVSQYCTNNGCTGPQGLQGEPGQDAPLVVDVIVNCTLDAPAVGPISCTSQVVYG